MRPSRRTLRGRAFGGAGADDRFGRNGQRHARVDRDQADRAEHVGPQEPFGIVELQTQEMSYTYDRILDDVGIDEAELRIRDTLAENGFGILTEIDVKATMKNKIGADMAPYRILGACNPDMAYKAIEIEPRIGAMLPCNVVVQKLDEDRVEVSAVDPVASMQAAGSGSVTSPIPRRCSPTRYLKGLGEARCR